MLEEESEGDVQAHVQKKPSHSVIPLMAVLERREQLADPVNVVDCPHVGVVVCSNLRCWDVKLTAMTNLPPLERASHS